MAIGDFKDLGVGNGMAYFLTGERMKNSCLDRMNKMGPPLLSDGAAGRMELGTPGRDARIILPAPVPSSVTLAEEEASERRSGFASN